MLGNSPPLYICVFYVRFSTSDDCMRKQRIPELLTFFHAKAKLGVVFLVGFQEEESLLYHQVSFYQL